MQQKNLKIATLFKLYYHTLKKLNQLKHFSYSKAGLSNIFKLHIKIHNSLQKTLKFNNLCYYFTNIILGLRTNFLSNYYNYNQKASFSNKFCASFKLK